MVANLRVQGGRAAAASQPGDACSLGGSSVLRTWLGHSIRCHVISFWESVGCPRPRAQVSWEGGEGSVGGRCEAPFLDQLWRGGLPDGSIEKWNGARHDLRHSRGYGHDLVVDIGQPSLALPAANVHDGSFGNIVKEQVHGPQGTDGVGPNSIEFKPLHPDGGVEGDTLKDLYYVLGGDHFSGGILAEHCKGVVWAGVTGGCVSSCSGFYGTEPAGYCFVGQRCIADSVLLVAEAEGDTGGGYKRFQGCIGCKAVRLPSGELTPECYSVASELNGPCLFGQRWGCVLSNL
jgi:hypothetical protein